MATLFRDFSFDAPSPSLADHEAERTRMNCSPTSVLTTPEEAYSSSRPLTPTPCTMGDLAQLMGGQKLFTSTRPSHDTAAGPPTPPSEDDTFPTEQLDPQAPRPTYCRASASIMRMQRQAHSRLQCCSSQAKDMSRLVRMIQEEEQCRVNQTATRPASASAAVQDGDDEAIDMDYAGEAGHGQGLDMDYECSLSPTEPLFSPPLYRAGDRHSDSARVSKHVRMRKRSSSARETRERRKTK